MGLIHGTCVEVGGTGVLLRGPPGSGKSDLALRLIDRGARLVADDQVDLAAGPGGLRARAPAALAGLLEVRGLGIATLPAAAGIPLRLVVDLVAEAAAIERLPEARSVTLEGVRLGHLVVWPFAASAAVKVRLAARQCGAGS